MALRNAVGRAVVLGIGAFLLSASAAWALPFRGTLTLDLSGIVTSIAGGGEAVSTSSSFQITSGGILGTVDLPITTRTTGGGLSYQAFPVVNLLLTGPAGLGAATFSAAGGPNGRFGGAAPLTGTARVGLFGPPPFAFLDVPLSVIGSPGATAMTSSPIGVQVSAFGTGWTTGVARLVASPVNGSPFSTRATGADLRTPDGEGTLILVSPTLVNTNIAGCESIPLISRLQLDIGDPMDPMDPMDPPDDPGPGGAVPEPGAALLFGAGLLLVGRRLRRA